MKISDFKDMLCRLKSKVNKRYVALTVGVLCCVIVSQIVQYTLANPAVKYHKVARSWVSAVLDNRLDDCDKYAFHSISSETKTDKYSDKYLQVLLSNMKDNSKLVSVEHDRTDGDMIYYRVTLDLPVYPTNVDASAFDDGTLNSLVYDFLANKITEKEYSEKLNDVVFEVFRGSLESSGSTTTTLDLVLSKGDNGYLVSNSNSFMDSLLTATRGYDYLDSFLAKLKVAITKSTGK